MSLRMSHPAVRQQGGSLVQTIPVTPRIDIDLEPGEAPEKIEVDPDSREITFKYPD